METKKKHEYLTGYEFHIIRENDVEKCKPKHCLMEISIEIQNVFYDDCFLNIV